ncbi:hypothetical protein TSUD_128310 [Trifolium subterraneum]|uniref:Uncharacterized protein n=1 Tax=Trifolium subterraneum TaxID=3900 RepID=A0A2Z6N3L6_TRISU|nr:hypothetical protein TSUD_128310 [Trifolium subterraneum]
MIWWKRILYHCIPVGKLDVEQAVHYYGMKQHESSLHNKCPKNYDTCYLFLYKCLEFAYPLISLTKRLLRKQNTSPSAYESKYVEEQFQPRRAHTITFPPKRTLLPENYATCDWFLKFAYIYIFGFLWVEKITKIKQKNTWSGQLLKFFMENPYESYLGSGGEPLRYVSGTDFKSAYNPNEGYYYIEDEDPWSNNDTEDPWSKKNTRDRKDKELIIETPILTAARNGIVEIVNEVITKVPHSIYEVNSENKNVLLVAVENRRTIVVEGIRKLFEERNQMEIFDNLIQGVDKKENTVLHLAAKSDQDWNISGAALKMMWHFKWFQFYTCNFAQWSSILKD